MDFKVGDWVILTKSTMNWNDDMNHYDGQAVKITKNDSGVIRFENSGGWSWVYNDGHYRKLTLREKYKIEGGIDLLKMFDSIIKNKDDTYKKKYS